MIALGNEVLLNDKAGITVTNRQAVRTLGSKITTPSADVIQHDFGEVNSSYGKCQFFFVAPRDK